MRPQRTMPALSWCPNARDYLAVRQLPTEREKWRRIGLVARQLPTEREKAMPIPDTYDVRLGR